MSKTAHQTGYDDFMNACYHREDLKSFNRNSYIEGWIKAKKEIVQKYEDQIKGQKIVRIYMNKVVYRLWKKQKGWDYITSETIHEFGDIFAEGGKSWPQFHMMLNLPYVPSKSPPKPMPHPSKMMVMEYLKDRLPNPDAEEALRLIRKLFNSETGKEKLLGYFTEKGTFVEVSRWFLQEMADKQRNYEDHGKDVQLPFKGVVATKTVREINYHEIEY